MELDLSFVPGPYFPDCIDKEKKAGTRLDMSRTRYRHAYLKMKAREFDRKGFRNKWKYLA